MTVVSIVLVCWLVKFEHPQHQQILNYYHAYIFGMFNGLRSLMVEMYGDVNSTVVYTLTLQWQVIIIACPHLQLLHLSW